MSFKFVKATKEKARLRLAIFGPSGSGKTYTALRLATGMVDSIAVIDTERGSASKYADRFSFDVLELPKRDIKTYVAAIRAAQEAGYEALIVDSLTHAWHELLDAVNKLARARYGGNTWSAWSEGTPEQRSLIDTILDYDGHIIATMRTKTEWTTTTNERGKTVPVRMGLAPEQGKGIEYEFDLLMELNIDHVATIIKDRTGKYQDAVITMPDEELGSELAAWLNEGEAPRKRKKKSEPAQPSDLPDVGQLTPAIVAQARTVTVKTGSGQVSLGDMDDGQFAATVAWIQRNGNAETHENEARAIAVLLKDLDRMAVNAAAWSGATLPNEVTSKLFEDTEHAIAALSRSWVVTFESDPETVTEWARHYRSARDVGDGQMNAVGFADEKIGGSDGS